MSKISCSVYGGEAVRSLDDEEAEKTPRAAAPFKRPHLQLITNNAIRRRVAVIDDDFAIHLYLKEVLGAEGFEVSEFHSGEEFLSHLRESRERDESFADILLCDVFLPGIDGLALTGQIKKFAPDLPIVLMTAFAGVESAVQAIREGAYDYLEKPFNSTRLVQVLENALKFHRLSYQNRLLYGLVEPAVKLPDVASASAIMKQIYDMVRHLASSDAPMLIMGEAGVGKRQLARMIHENSLRRDLAFTEFNCSEIPESLVGERLLGANGVIQRSQSGTIYLQEISELPLFLHEDLLNQLRELDVRVIASSSRDLRDMVELGLFNPDLFYFFSAVTLEIPPLRYRSEDIPGLAEYFLQEFCKQEDKKILGFKRNAIKKLMQLPFRGNSYELKELVRAAVERASGEYITAEDLPVPQSLLRTHEPLVTEESHEHYAE